jgi:F0F1-type ATP synthase membrane subunit b/b'
LAIAEKVIRKELSSDAAQKQLIDDLIKDQTSQGEES